MADELIINRETAESIAEAIRDGLNPETAHRAITGDNFAEKIREGYEYQSSQGFSSGVSEGRKVRTWNVLSNNDFTTIMAYPNGGGGDWAPDCPYEISLKRLLSKDVVFNVTYCLTYSDAVLVHDYHDDPFFSPVGDWQSPVIRNNGSDVATSSYGKLTFNLTKDLYNNGILVLYGETVYNEYGNTACPYEYRNILVAKESLTKATFIKPIIDSTEATALLENSVK